VWGGGGGRPSRGLEGGAREGAGSGFSARLGAKEVEGRRCLRGGGGKWLSTLGAGCSGDGTRWPGYMVAGPGCGARAQSRSSTYLRGWKWAGMGRNTVPEVKPPAPSPGAGGVPEGNHSPYTATPPPPPPPVLSVLAPPPLSALPPRSGGGRESIERRAVVAPPTMARLGGTEKAGLEGGKKVGLEEEELEKGRGRGVRRRGACVMMSREELLYTGPRAPSRSFGVWSFIVLGGS
jgi:hypothetical protein